MTHSCIVCAKNFKTRNALSTHYTRYHANDVLSPWTNRTWANKCFPKLMGVFTFDRLTIINGLGNELHHNFDPNLNFRPEYVAGVDDSTSRRWWTIEVSVSNVWKDHVGQNKDEAPRWSAPGPRPHMHRMSKAVQNQKLFVSSLFFDAQEPSPVSVGNNLTWNTADHVLVVMCLCWSCTFPTVWINRFHGLSFLWLWPSNFQSKNLQWPWHSWYYGTVLATFKLSTMEKLHQ